MSPAICSASSAKTGRKNERSAPFRESSREIYQIGSQNVIEVRATARGVVTAREAYPHVLSRMPPVPCVAKIIAKMLKTK
jgi:hypothetical protein